MASIGKKGKKSKGKAISLQSFLATNSEGLQEGYSIVTPKRVDWATEVERALDDEEFLDPVYSGRDQYILPSAPMGANVDLSKVPSKPPFTAFLGNLPYEIEENDISALFKDLKILSIRLPRFANESGRQRGFGYVEFEDQQSLIDALGRSETNLRTAKIKIDVAESQDDPNRRRDNRGAQDRPDRMSELSSDWRSAREDMPTRGSEDNRGYGGREDRYGDRNSSNRESRYGNRTHGGFDQDQHRSGGFGGSRFTDKPDRNRSDDFSRSDFGSDRRNDDFGRSDRRNDDFGRSDRSRSDDFSRADFGMDRTRDDFGRSRGAGGGRDDFGRSDRRGRDDFNRFDRQSGRDDFSSFERGSRSGGFGGSGRREFGTSYGRMGGGDDRRGDYGRNRNYDNRENYDRGSGGGGYNDPESTEKDREEDPDQPPSSAQEQIEKEAVVTSASKERPTLVLQKRTKPIGEPAAPAPSSSSIFGGARPVDTAAREREIEMKLAKEQEVTWDRDARRDTSKETSAGGQQAASTDEKQAKRMSGGRSPRTSTSSQPNESGGSHHEDEDQRNAVTTERESASAETSRPLQKGVVVQPPVPQQKRPEVTPAPPPAENAWSKRSGASVLAPQPTKPPALEEKAKLSDSLSETDELKEASQKDPPSDNRRDEDTNGSLGDEIRSNSRVNDRGVSRGGVAGGRKPITGFGRGREGRPVRDVEQKP